jgi:hypothetical protein
MEPRPLYLLIPRCLRFRIGMQFFGGLRSLLGAETRLVWYQLS